MNEYCSVLVNASSIAVMLKLAMQRQEVPVKYFVLYMISSRNWCLRMKWTTLILLGSNMEKKQICRKFSLTVMRSYANSKLPLNLVHCIKRHYQWTCPEREIYYWATRKTQGHWWFFLGLLPVWKVLPSSAVSEESSGTASKLRNHCINCWCEYW